MTLTTSATLAGFPDAQNTGVRDGVTLTVVGDMTVTTPGAVISGLEIHGTLRIEADNVTVRDCKIINDDSAYNGILIPDGNTGAVVEYCDIIGAINGISGAGTFRFNDFDSNENGINVYGPSLIQDNYIHNMSGLSTAHYDGIEINGGGGTTIRHNTIINENDQTSGVMIDNYFGSVSGIIVDNNYIAGGGYTIYSDAGFSSTEPITGVQITNNYLGQGYWGYYAFKNNDPLVSDNHLLGKIWPTPVSGGGTSTDPQPSAPVIASFSNDTGKAGDGITSDNTLQLKGTAAANSTVKIYDGATQIGTTTANSTGSWDYITSVLNNAKHVLTATATNSSGQTSAASGAVTVTVDTVAPTAPVLSSNSIVNTNQVKLSGTAEANSTVTVYDGSTVVGTGTAELGRGLEHHDERPVGRHPRADCKGCGRGR